MFGVMTLLMPTGCTTGTSGSGAAKDPPAGPTPAPPIATEGSAAGSTEGSAAAIQPIAILPFSCNAEDSLAVSTAQELTAALRDAKPGNAIVLQAGTYAGNAIVLQDGTYAGNFVAPAAGTADSPILLCGSRNAILDSGGPKEGYDLHLDGASGWQFLGSPSPTVRKASWPMALSAI